MKNTIIILLSAFGGIAGLFLFIKMTFYSIKNDLRVDADKKEINQRIANLEAKHHNAMVGKNNLYDFEVHKNTFKNLPSNLPNNTTTNS